MPRATLAWTLVAFFGATVVFAAIRRAVEDESVVLSLALQLAAAALFIAVVAVVLRRRR